MSCGVAAIVYLWAYHLEAEHNPSSILVVTLSFGTTLPLQTSAHVVGATRTRKVTIKMREYRVSIFQYPLSREPEGRPRLNRLSHDYTFMSSRNSDAGSTLVISKWSRARVQAT